MSGKERLVIRIPPRATNEPHDLPTTAPGDMSDEDAPDVGGDGAEAVAPEEDGVAVHEGETQQANVDDDDEEGGELVDEVEKFLDDTNDDEEMDAEDGPDWQFEEGETRSPNPLYVFCPAPHRKPILRLFTKHFCQHPLFPERDGPRTATEIRKHAVMEMYQFCQQRGLREVWGYLWTSWYALKVWRLWARSTSPYISRLRTTMNVENFWRQLKHNHLHHMLRPRLDLLIWILLNKVTPEYVARAEVLEDTHRLGRSKPLSTYQRYFKSAWKGLSATTVSRQIYITNVETWTCNCGHQKYQRHHICKHLVQAVPNPPLSFWRKVVRRRVRPLYRHPALVQLGDVGVSQAEVAYFDPDDGSVTDGDDHVWLGDREVLMDGAWRGFDIEGAIGKRPRSVMSSSAGDELSSTPEDLDSVQDQLMYDPEDSDLEDEVSIFSQIRGSHNTHPINKATTEHQQPCHPRR